MLYQKCVVADAGMVYSGAKSIKLEHQVWRKGPKLRLLASRFPTNKNFGSLYSALLYTTGIMPMV